VEQINSLLNFNAAKSAQYTEHTITVT